MIISDVVVDSPSFVILWLAGTDEEGVSGYLSQFQGGGVWIYKDLTSRNCSQVQENDFIAHSTTLLCAMAHAAIRLSNPNRC